jgi:hypothetical protein
MERVSRHTSKNGIQQQLLRCSNHQIHIPTSHQPTTTITLVMDSTLSTHSFTTQLTTTTLHRAQQRPQKFLELTQQSYDNAKP